MPLAVLIIIAAVVSSLFRALTPWARQYKTEVEQHLSTILGEAVTINTMETGWYWFEPVIKLKQVSVSDGHQAVVKLDKLLVGINLFSSLWHWQLQPGILYIEDLHLNLRQTRTSWQIEGIDAFETKNKVINQASSQAVLGWILSQQKIVIKNLSAHVNMLDGTIIPVFRLNLNISNHSGHFKIKGGGLLAQTSATSFQLLANLRLDPYALNKASGNLFFAAKQVLVAQWQGFAPSSNFNIQGGNGGFRVWVDIAEGHITNIQTKLNFHNLAWIETQTNTSQLVQTLKANMAWKPTKTGWELAADQIRLRLGDRGWPKNSLLIRYNQESKAYFIYVKHIVLRSLLETAIVWPESISGILAAKPEGRLYDSQIEIDQSGLHYVLSRFSKLGWQPNDRLPGMSNLTGVLHWQPEEGRLEFDGTDALITAKNKPAISFSTINAAVSWQQLTDGLQIKAERFVLNHPQLQLNIVGAMEGISENSKGRITMKAEFSATKAQQWLTYLPSASLKPKLNAWLKEDVKRITQASGELIIDGALADFPFDKQQGQFLLRGHLSGVNLYFAHGWPIVKDIEGYFRVDKRNLEADIVHANINKVIIDKGNLRIDDIGLDRENLLVHTQIKTPADKALSYVLSSPLKKKLASLAKLKMQGSLDLDLHLEAPLYPENDDVLARGELQFENDEIEVQQGKNKISLTALNGHLSFDQDGILGSGFKANLLNFPVNMAIQSIHVPKPYTRVSIDGRASAEVLNQQLNFPLLKLMNGSLGLESVLSLTDEPGEKDHLSLQSSMVGLSIDLPAPLGKLADLSRPLVVDMDFDAEQLNNLRFNYDNKLTGNLLFSPSSSALTVQKGEIHLGSGGQVEKKREGLQLLGSLASFDLQEWLAVKAKLGQSDEKMSLLDALSLVDLKLLQAAIGGQQFKSLGIKAVKVEPDKWAIHLNQVKVAADLYYRPKTNTLTGQFNKLQLENTLSSTGMGKAVNSKLEPADLPNLNLRVRSLQLGELDVGELSLRTHSLPDLWQIDSCELNTPFYQLTAAGRWQQTASSNTTKLRANLSITDLAKSLERWKINPAVEAKRGELAFDGGWNGGLADFQLAKINGQLQMSFKEGRITHLSPETEEKLGLGKLLSILSLQTIPRRLKLDFSDLSKDGYSFDEFKGNFDLAKGILTTQDSYINGPVAYASMKGNLDLAKQHYNLDLKISPHITASLPIVATIAGGPIAGLATWVASKIINQGMQKISGYTYKVSGPWKEPIVEQVKIIKKRKVLT